MNYPYQAPDGPNPLGNEAQTIPGARVPGQRGVYVRVRRLTFQGVEPLPLPVYQSAGAAGFDLSATLFHCIPPREIVSIGTGLAVALPDGYEIQIRSRSGLAARGIVVANSPGTIDSDYRGEIRVLLHNTTDILFHVARGDRIAQGVLAAAPRAVWIEVDDLGNTARGDASFGSTDL